MSMSGCHCRANPVCCLIWIKAKCLRLTYIGKHITAKETGMYQNIICAVDGSELSTKALAHALALAGKTGAKVTAVTVTEPSVIVSPGAEMMMVDTSTIIADLDKAKAESAKATLAEAGKLAATSGAAITTLHVPNSTAADGIIQAAKDAGADLIVMGSHGRRGLGRLLLGSQAAEVLSHTSLPVLIVK